MHEKTVQESRNRNEMDLHHRDRKQGSGAPPYDHEQDSGTGQKPHEKMETRTCMHEDPVQGRGLPGTGTVPVQTKQSDQEQESGGIRAGNPSNEERNVAGRNQSTKRILSG